MPAPVPTSKIIVLADDLSGAAELAGIAFAHGLPAEVQRQFEPATGAQLIAIDTDSRHLSVAAAADRVRSITAQVLTTEPAWIFKKVDSVLRGNVRAEIEAILETTGQSRALLIPANPSRGRVIRGGHYFIDGIPLGETHFAQDPEHPRRSSDVLALLGPKSVGAADVMVPDVETQSQLEELAAQCDPTTLAAGGADFFSALLERRAAQPIRGRESLSGASLLSATSTTDKDSRPLFAKLTIPALLVCGSRAAWPSRRKQCEAVGIPILAIASGFGTGPSDFQRLLIGIDESERADSRLLLTLLARLTSYLIENFSPAALLAEGGATAAAIANEMDWLRFEIVAIAPAGVGVLQPLATDAPLFLIKPGSYPWPAQIWQQFCVGNDHRGGR